MSQSDTTTIKRSGRSGAYRLWRFKVEDAFRWADMHQEADRWASCSDPAMFFTPQPGELLPKQSMGVLTCADDPDHLTKNICPSCDYRVCPDCAHRHSARLLNRYMPLLKECADNPRKDWRLRQVVLTTAVDLTDGDLRARIATLWSSVRKTFEKALRDAYKRPVAISEVGLLAAMEFGADGHKLHFHCLYYGPWIYQSVLSEIWRQLTGYFIVHISEIGPGKRNEDIESAAAEVLKYTTKFWKRKKTGEIEFIDPELVPILHQALQGTRRIRSYGLFYNAAEEEQDAACPTCGGPLCILSLTEYDIYRQTGWMPPEFKNAVTEDALFNLILADKSDGKDPPTAAKKRPDPVDLRHDLAKHAFQERFVEPRQPKRKTRKPDQQPPGKLLL